jgi:hypothetical protein
MKTKLLKKLRKLAKEAITINCEVFRNDTKYLIYKNGYCLVKLNSICEAINFVNKKRREHILFLIDNMREEKLNKELSKI